MLRKVAFTGLVFSLLLVCGQDLGAQERKGFIIGFGIGAGLTTWKVSVDELAFESERETKGSLATDFKIGAQVSPAVQVYYLNRVQFFGGSDFIDVIVSGVSAIGVTYVLPSSPQIQLSGGVGLSSWNEIADGSTVSAIGFGLTGGFGYEFADLWLLDISVTYGMPSDSGVDFDKFQARAGISILSH